MTAIFHEEDLPEQWAHYAAIDRGFFGSEVTGLGSPGGAAAIGELAHDHPHLASIPVA